MSRKTPGIPSSAEVRGQATKVNRQALVDLFFSTKPGDTNLWGERQANLIVDILLRHPMAVVEALELPHPGEFQELVLDRNNLWQALAFVLIEHGPLTISSQLLVENPRTEIQNEPRVFGDGVVLSAQRVDDSA